MGGFIFPIVMVYLGSDQADTGKKWRTGGGISTLGKMKSARI